MRKNKMPKNQMTENQKPENQMPETSTEKNCFPCGADNIYISIYIKGVFLRG